jgi:hypothetical protein
MLVIVDHRFRAKTRQVELREDALVVALGADADGVDTLDPVALQ